MPKDDWSRKKTWLPHDQEDFFAHLKRSRDGYNRGQHLAVQALTLQEVGESAAALSLVEQVLREHPDQRPTQMHKCKAECLWSLGDKPSALKSYRAAVESQRKFPHDLCHPALSFAERFHDYADGAYRLELLDYLNEEVKLLRLLPPFPMDEFRYSVTYAQLLSALGNQEEASIWARRALNAQSKTKSGFRYHQTLGLVGDISASTEAWLRDLVATSPQSD